MVKSKIEGSSSISSSSELKVNAKWRMTSLDSRKKKASRARKALIRPSSSVNITSPAMGRALEIQASLEPHFPNFVKQMLQSHVAGGFWLGLPKKFCDTHLPKKGVPVILEDEDKEEFETKYLYEKTGLSAGWRGYSIHHKLVRDDVLVFQLIRHCVFKVHTVRVNEMTAAEGARNLFTLSCHADSAPENAMPEHLRLHAKRADCENTSVETTDSNKDSFNEHDSANNERDGFVPEIFNSSIGLAEPSALKFEDVKNFETFKILVNGHVLDLKIQRHLREKYYELCCTRNMFLHGDLIKHLDVKLAVEIISETVRIADAVRAVKPGKDSDDYLDSWDRTLQAFEGLGMSVGFLRERIRVLMDLSGVPRAMIESRRKEIATLEDEERELESKLSNVRGSKERLETEIDRISMEGNDGIEYIFEQIARSPWSRA